MSKNYVIYGDTPFAEELFNIISFEGRDCVVAFTNEKAFMTREAIRGLRVIPFDELIKTIEVPFEVLLAYGYTKMNSLREKVYNECKPEVVNKVSIKPENINAIKEGMLSVTVDGTGRAALGDYPIKIGGKTGTSQTNSGADHSTFIVFAPYDNPKIAISVVLEHGHSSYTSGNIVRNILDYCFFSDENKKQDAMPYTVLD